MSEESFYGVTLTGQDSSVPWDVLSNDEDFPRGQRLIIKQILLGAEAKEDEFNVVEVHTVKDSLKIPIAVLKAGETRAVNPDVEFYETSLTFKLIKGNGPVYIMGQNIKDDVVDIEDEETDEETGEEEEEETQPQKKKQKVENNSDGKNAKNKKK
ncbi:PREDICTED: nucleoplasmin-like protein [Bactrocera latifrons]|uniref:Nucleoplasmin-like protein n=2 Tax=Bactrocera TaxID=47832 RepID=A0A034V1S4_BACDO|nr:nucleoplasmin-like protein [Bactrocera dorsalis]XP_014092423.1 nucleoplasmin-like protein [Bactrocera oleae]XP_018797197.1 PREDICTED: nucleoplasmin-like protein [Bactrocera latifrons]XP_039948295.1 nucleoplasmin-like protein [Bactrocera tryoni]XP_050317207.1 nucleoplasmin-like protein [Bactrocera neohumeralis]